MAGHLAALKDKKGKTLKRADGTTIWRARYPDPLKGGTAQIERRFRSKRDAENWLDSMTHGEKSGMYVDPRKGERLLSEVAQQWRETWTDLEPKTRTGYANILDKHIVGEDARFHRARVGAMSPDVIQRFVNDLAETRASNTVRRIYTVLRSVLRVAVERRYIAVNPCDAVKLPRKRTANKRKQLFLSAPEVAALADAIDPHYRVAVYVAAWCGFRAGEQWALRREDVDLRAGTLRVDEAIKEVTTDSTEDLRDVRYLTPSLVIGVPKTEASHRTITMPAPIRAMVAEHLSTVDADEQAFIFTTPTGRPMRHNLFYKRVFQPAVRSALPHYADYKNRRGLRWHDLRHTCASLSLAVSPNLFLVKERLGHDDIRTTINTYGHLVPSVDAALADGLAALFEAENVVPLRAAG